MPGAGPVCAKHKDNMQYSDNGRRAAVESLEIRRLFTVLFAPVQKFPTGGSGAQGIISADFNGDKRPDVAVTHSGSGNVTIFLNQGSGKFTALKPFNAGANLSGIVAADFNADG